MRKFVFLVTVLSLSPQTWCAEPLRQPEQLPESASVPDDDSDEMSNRFGRPAMNSSEMESLYLPAPISVDDTSSRGLEGLNDDERYTETDLRFRDQRQAAGAATPVTPPSEATPKPELPPQYTPKPIQPM